MALRSAGSAAWRPLRFQDRLHLRHGRRAVIGLVVALVGVNGQVVQLPFGFGGGGGTDWVQRPAPRTSRPDARSSGSASTTPAPPSPVGNDVNHRLDVDRRGDRLEGLAVEDVHLGHAPGDIVLGHEVDRAPDGAADFPSTIPLRSRPGSGWALRGERRRRRSPARHRYRPDRAGWGSGRRGWWGRYSAAPGDPRTGHQQRYPGGLIEGVAPFLDQPTMRPSRSPWSEVNTTMVSSAIPDLPALRILPMA